MSLTSGDRPFCPVLEQYVKWKVLFPSVRKAIFQ